MAVNARALLNGYAMRSGGGIYYLHPNTSVPITDIPTGRQPPSYTFQRASYIQNLTLHNNYNEGNATLTLTHPNGTVLYTKTFSCRGSTSVQDMYVPAGTVMTNKASNHVDWNQYQNIIVYEVLAIALDADSLTVI